MPARVENINPFDLRLLKALLNFKITKSHSRDLTTPEKRALCKNSSEAGTLTITGDHLVRIWPKRGQISFNVTLDTLDQLCGLLNANYEWNNFLDDIENLRPQGIPNNKEYHRLNDFQKEEIEKIIAEIFYRFKSFEEFKSQIIDKKLIGEVNVELIKNNISIENGHKSVIRPFPNSPNSFNVLILPFRNPENNSASEVGGELESKLVEKNRIESFDLNIRYLFSYDNKATHLEAKKIGNELDADIVIWGQHSKPDSNSSHHIYFHYVFPLTINHEKLRGRTDKFETERLIEITEGKLQLEIEDVIYWVLASKFFLNKDFANALVFYKKINNNEYINEDLFTCMAHCCIALQFFEEAKLYYQNAVKIDPQNALTHYNYANFALATIGDIVSAKEHYEAAIRIDPEFAWAHHNYALLMNTAFNDIEKANEHYEAVLKIDPEFVPTHYNYAILLDTKFNDIEKAKEHYEAVLRIDPEFMDIHKFYAFFMYERFKDIEKAIEHYEAALKKDSHDSDVLHNYIHLLTKIDDKEKAKNKFENHLENYPDHALGHLTYASMLIRDFYDLRNAKEHYLRAIELNPSLKNKLLDDAFGME